MGNYRGNPDNFPNAVAEYDDSVPPGAAQFNPAIEGAQDQIASLRAFIGSAICSNWGSPVNVGTSTVDAIYCWDPCAVRWLAYANESGTNALLSTHDSGKTWVSAAGSAPGGQAVALSATGVFGDTMLAWLSAGTTLHFDFFTSAGAKTTGTNGFATTHVGLGYLSMNPAGVAVFQRHAFCFNQAGANFTATWLGNTDGGVPGTWTSFVGLLPAAWQGPTALHIGEVIVADTKRAGAYGVPAAGDVMAVCLAGATIGTDAPMLLKITSNGPGVAATVADETINLPAPGPPFIVSGLDFDEVNKIWGILLVTGGPGAYFYTSPDLVTWTLVHHFTQYSGSSEGGCAAVQGTWAVWMATNNLLFNDSTNRILYSWNVGQKGAAATWTGGQGMSLAPASNLPLGPCHLRSNGAQLLAGMGHDAGGQTKAVVSHWAGFALQGGAF
jgi:hypothetical protein